MKDLGEGVDLKLFEACGVEIQYTYDFQKEKEREAAIHNYVTWFPLRSWNNLISGLREVGQHELAEKVRSKYMHGMFVNLTFSFVSLRTYYIIHFLGYSGDDIDPPVITEHPNLPEIIQRDGSLSLNVSANGEGTLSYQWIKDGVAFFEEELSNCTGADTRMLCITSFTEDHEGEYKCVVSNAGGSVESKTIELIGKTLMSEYTV